LSQEEFARRRAEEVGADVLTGFVVRLINRGVLAIARVLEPKRSAAMDSKQDTGSSS
jgi:hypothetical protein